MGNICQKFVPQPKRNYRSTPFKSISSNLNEHLPLKQMNNDQCEVLSLTSQNTQSYLSNGNLKETEQQKQLKINIQNFQPIRRLGRGSFGQVLLVKNKQNSVNYALKVIEKKSIINYQQKINTLSQRYLLQALDFPFIVKLHYAFQSKTRLYLLVDYMGGGQLFYLLRKKKNFTEEQAKFYAAEILLALQYLHSRNIIYRDLKPQNILLTNEGHIKIADFGLSKICFNKNQLAYSICGTPQYIAPQIITGKGYTQSADWFSFGSLLYDMLTGRPPFFSKNKHRILYNITTKQIPIPETLSAEAQSLLKGLFIINPQDRLGSKQGAKQIKNHDFFQGIDFEQLKKLNVKPPLKFDQTLVNREGFDEQMTQKSIQFHFQDQKLMQDPLFEHYEYIKSNGSLVQKNF